MQQRDPYKRGQLDQIQLPYIDCKLISARKQNKQTSPSVAGSGPAATARTSSLQLPTSAVRTPTHLDIIRVDRSTKSFGSGAMSLVERPAGSLFAHITTATPGVKAYTTVQTGPNMHVELNSDLVFCNHSCDPSVVFDMGKMEVRVVDHKQLKMGDALTFFYPSSEWEMDQPFHCTCGAGDGICKGWISGAKTMSDEELKGYWLNDHIAALIKARNDP